MPGITRVEQLNSLPRSVSLSSMKFFFECSTNQSSRQTHLPVSGLIGMSFQRACHFLTSTLRALLMPTLLQSWTGTPLTGVSLKWASLMELLTSSPRRTCPSCGTDIEWQAKNWVEMIVSRLARGRWLPIKNQTGKVRSINLMFNLSVEQRTRWDQIPGTSLSGSVTFQLHPFSSLIHTRETTWPSSFNRVQLILLLTSIASISRMELLLNSIPVSFFAALIFYRQNCSIHSPSPLFFSSPACGKKVSSLFLVPSFIFRSLPVFTLFPSL